MLANHHFTTMLPVTDVARARRFYEEKLGLSPLRILPDGEVVYESDGGMFALYPRPTPPKADHTALTFEVSSIDLEMRDLRERGVLFEEYDLPGIRTRNGVALIGGEKAAWFKDPDGNILCIHETVSARASESAQGAGI